MQVNSHPIFSRPTETGTIEFLEQATKISLQAASGDVCESQGQQVVYPSRWDDFRAVDHFNGVTRCVLSIVSSVVRAMDWIGMLKPFMTFCVKRAMASGRWGTPSPFLRQTLVCNAMAMVDATRHSANRRNSIWDRLSCQLYEQTRLQTGLVPPRCSSVDFTEALERALGCRLTLANKVKWLHNGPMAFDKRYRWLRNAKKRIFILAFRIDNDNTGRHFSALIAEAAQRGVKVRVLVDRNASFRQDNRQTLRVIEAAGGTVLRWVDTAAPLHCMHSKMFIVDNQAILGGINCGDAYSRSWQVADADHNMQVIRDSDILLSGPVMKQVLNAFAMRWDQMAKEDDRMSVVDMALLPASKIPKQVLPTMKPQRCLPSGKTKAAAVAVVSESPGLHGDHPITRGLLQLIWGAVDSIDIEHGYFIDVPPLAYALKKAVERGVKVRLLSNSAQTTYEPLIASSLVISAQQLQSLGAAVYLQKDTYLHSKILIVDHEYVVVGSFNLHPRSLLFDCEVAAFIKSKVFADAAHRCFEADIAEDVAVDISTCQPVKPNGWSDALIQYNYYDHL